MATKYLDSTGLSYLWGKIKTYLSTNYQAKLTSGTNIKTINNTSLLGSGNIDVSGGGGTSYEEYDQTVTVTLASMGSGYTNPTWGFALITAPSNVPTDAWAEIISTNGWGFLVRMSNTTPPSYRFMVMGATSGSRTITLRWHWHD